MEISRLIFLLGLIALSLPSTAAARGPFEEGKSVFYKPKDMVCVIQAVNGHELTLRPTDRRLNWDGEFKCPRADVIPLSSAVSEQFQKNGVSSSAEQIAEVPSSEIAH